MGRVAMPLLSRSLGSCILGVPSPGSERKVRGTRKHSSRVVPSRVDVNRFDAEAAEEGIAVALASRCPIS